MDCRYIMCDATNDVDVTNGVRLQLAILVHFVPICRSSESEITRHASNKFLECVWLFAVLMTLYTMYFLWNP